MKESEAWLLVAESLDREERKDDGFLCNEIQVRQPDIPTATQEKMLDRVEEALGDYCVAYWYADGFADPLTEDRQARVTAACLFSAIASDEGN